MNGFDSILSQDRPIRTITRFLLNNRIPHSLLFTGIEGVGKRTTALAFAMAANCSGAEAAVSEKSLTENHRRSPRINACGVCRSCLKIGSKIHPDVFHVEPEGSMIKIHHIRDVGRRIAFKPYEARFRFVIIGESHAMNASAANALLKLLEEPPDRTVLILTARETSDLLPTIVSRCRHIRFNPISQKDIEQLLVQNAGIPAAQAVIPAIMAAGSYSRALTIGRSNWVHRRKWLIAASGLDNPETLPRQSLSLLLAFSEKLAKNKSMVMDSLEVMKTWLRDLLVYRYTPDRIMHKDLIDLIKKASVACTAGELIRKIEAVSRAQKDIADNLNLRLSLDIMMLRLASNEESL
ncbi:MAG: DNA polymerase III subunit delta' [Desulfobacterales bacterium]